MSLLFNRNYIRFFRVVVIICKLEVLEFKVLIVEV